jgi:hypothetical protein
MIKHVFLLFIAISLSACLVTVDSDSRITQNTWNEGDLNNVKMGVTDTQWVRTSFGEPASRVTYADGKEVWKYRNRSEKDTEVGLFLVLSVDVEEERVETLSIEFINGVVSNFWTEVIRH